MNQVVGPATRIDDASEELTRARAENQLMREALCMAYGTLLAIGDNAGLTIAERIGTILFPAQPDQAEESNT
jgi:hypothetical protein